MNRRSPSLRCHQTSHTALYDYLNCGDTGGDPVPHFGEMRERESDCIPNLNESQRDAVVKAVGVRTFISYGDRRNGQDASHRKSFGVDGTILLSAFTNTAVDKILQALLDADRGSISRIGVLRFEGTGSASQRSL